VQQNLLKLSFLKKAVNKKFPAAPEIKTVLLRKDPHSGRYS